MSRLLHQVSYEASAWMTCVFTLVLVAFLGFIDHVTGYEISFSIFYLLPISIGVWYGSRLVGYVSSFASAVTWGFVEQIGALPYSAHWILYWNTAVRLGFFLVVAWLLAELKANLRRHQWLATTDNLTGLLNRPGFIDRVAPIVAAASRHGHPTTIGFADLDGFKQVNDRLGHAQGDAVLQLMGTLLMRSCRGSDVSARFGGDEFVVLLPHTGLPGARSFFGKFHETAQNEMHKQGWKDIGLSIGAIVFEDGIVDLREALRLADGLMYRAKEPGSGSVLVETAASCEST